MAGIGYHTDISPNTGFFVELAWVNAEVSASYVDLGDGIDGFPDVRDESAVPRSKLP